MRGQSHGYRHRVHVDAHPGHIAQSAKRWGSQNGHVIKSHPPHPKFREDR